MSFNGLSAGDYVVRLYYNDSYDLKYELSFTVEGEVEICEAGHEGHNHCTTAEDLEPCEAGHEGHNHCTTVVIPPTPDPEPESETVVLCATVTVNVVPVNDEPEALGPINYEIYQDMDLIVGTAMGLRNYSRDLDNTHLDGLGCDPLSPDCPVKVIPIQMCSVSTSVVRRPPMVRCLTPQTPGMVHSTTGRMQVTLVMIN
jgi:hypothetical protein